jgi:hypothetical protein
MVLFDFVSAALLLFTESVYVGSPLFADFCGLFTQLWPPFVDSVYVGSPLYIDSRGFFMRLWPLFADYVYIGVLLYIATFGGLCVLMTALRRLVILL